MSSQNTNNHFQEFIDECIDFTNDSPAPYFHLDMMYMIYIDWYKYWYNDNKEMNRRDFKYYLDDKLSSNLPLSQRRKIAGYKLHIKWRHYYKMGADDVFNMLRPLN